MSEHEALTLAWSVLEKEGLREVIAKVATIHFSTAQERRKVLGDDHPDESDYWCIDFALKLDEGVVDQIPDSISIQIDNRTSVVAIDYQM